NRPYVEAIYPTATILPENLLRIYINFSQPMKTVGNIEKIKLIDENGKEVKNVFFNNAQELWNRQQTQLTLILDPARQKSGLKTNETFGYALKKSKNYTLIIDGLEDVNHQKMDNSFKKKITVSKADVSSPKIENWNLTIPKANSKNSLEVNFSEILDYNSLKQRLIITDDKNRPIKGILSLEQEETKWNFKPEQNWKSGAYILHVNTRLEDPCGNNLNGLFDHKIGSLKHKKEGVIEKVPFTIKP
ncbi:MAG: hypothetical protein AAGH46_04410, partial [Bacteroidota bacterium]